MKKASKEFKKNFKKEEKKLLEELEKEKESVIGSLEIDDSGNIKRKITRTPNIQKVLNSYFEKLNKGVNQQRISSFPSWLKENEGKKIKGVKILSIQEIRGQWGIPFIVKPGEDEASPELKPEEDISNECFRTSKGVKILTSVEHSDWLADQLNKEMLFTYVRDLLNTPKKSFYLGDDSYFFWMLNCLLYDEKVDELISDYEFSFNTLTPTSDLNESEKRLLNRLYREKLKFDPNAGWELALTRPNLSKSIPEIKDRVKQVIEDIRKKKSEKKFRPNLEEASIAYFFKPKEMETKDDEDEDDFHLNESGEWEELEPLTYRTSLKDAVCKYCDERGEWPESTKEQEKKVDLCKKLRKRYPEYLKKMFG